MPPTSSRHGCIAHHRRMRGIAAVLATVVTLLASCGDPTSIDTPRNRFVDLPPVDSSGSFAAALVLDAGTTHQDTIRAAGIYGGQAFTGRMDSTRDEVAVVWFAEKATRVQALTASPTLIRDALLKAPAATPTRVLWDGVMNGIEAVQRTDTTRVHAVITLTTAFENAGTTKVDSVLARALRMNIRLYAIGVGDKVPTETLRNLAAATGGAYYAVAHIADVPAAFHDIAAKLRIRR